MLAVVTAVAAPERLAGHFHDTGGMALDNIRVALDHGLSVFDASVGGLGGCPFAPGATGNIATEDLVYALHRSGFDTGVDLAAAIEASTWLGEQLGRDLPAYLPRAGVFPGNLAR